MIKQAHDYRTGLAAVLLAAAVSAQGQPTSRAATHLIDGSASPVVSIRSIVNVQRGTMGNRDAHATTSGVVVCSSGLTIVPYSGVNPYASRGNPMAGEAPEGRGAELISVSMRRPDGQLLAAEVVLHDSDLNIAFVRPLDDAQAQGFVAAAFDGEAGEVDVLDPVLVLGRLAGDAAWQPSVRRSSIRAILRTPWPCPAVDGEQGQAIYTPDGNLVGVVVPLESPGPRDRPVSTVLPTSRIRPLIEQALAIPRGDAARKPVAKDNGVPADIFHAPQRLAAEGEPILLEDHGYTCPTIADLNDDGLDDLIVGWYDYADDAGNQRGNLYLNEGSATEPKYGAPEPIEIDGDALLLPTY